MQRLSFYPAIINPVHHIKYISNLYFLCVLYPLWNSRKNEEVGGIAEVTEKIEELVLASQSLPDVTSAIRELTDLAAVKRLTLTQSQLPAIKHGFSCAFCLSKYPMDLFYMVCATISLTNKHLCFIVSNQCLLCASHFIFVMYSNRYSYN